MGPGRRSARLEAAVGADGVVHRARGLRWAFVFGLALAGCGPAYGEEFLLAFRAGERAYHDGRYDEAAAAFDRAAAHATRVKDRDEARFMRARTAEKQGDLDTARGVYERIASATPAGPRAPRAWYEIAELDIARGDEERGFAELEKALLAYPDHGSARAALDRLVQHLADTAGEGAARAWIGEHLPRFAGTEADQHARYALARSWERSGALAEAHDAYLDAARSHPYPEGPLTDDAFYRASEVAEALGRYEQAVADLREMLSAREIANDGQSYERPRFPMAQMRIAVLYRDRLGDLGAARAEFRRMWQNHRTSLLADDAIWQEASLAARMGDAGGACDVAATIVGDFAGSRFARCVKLVCPSATPPDGVPPCPDYIAHPRPDDAEDP